MIALSGVYDARFFVGDNLSDEVIYLASDYIWNQNDGWFIDPLSTEADIIVCTGLGRLGRMACLQLYEKRKLFWKA